MEGGKDEGEGFAVGGQGESEDEMFRTFGGGDGTVGTDTRLVGEGERTEVRKDGWTREDLAEGERTMRFEQVLSDVGELRHDGERRWKGRVVRGLRKGLVGK